MTDRRINIIDRKSVKCSGRMILAVLLFLAMRAELRAQDLHFSQFFSAPLITNPANTGMAGDNLRFSNIYRNQWSKIGIPFQTVSSSIDKKFILFGQPIGIGGTIIHDQSASYNLSANELLVSFSYSKIYNNQQISIGLQSGFVYKSYNLEGLTFGSQFDQSNQIFNSTLPSQENSLADHLNNFDLNLGIMWQTKLQNMIPMAGIAISHINMPLEKFSTSTIGTRMPMRMTVNSQVIVPVSGSIYAVPCFLYSYTPGATEFLLGGTGNYTLAKSNAQIKELYGLAMIRTNPVRNVDALIVGGGFGFATFTLGLTYDLNISPLHTVTNFNGAFEISLVYSGKKSVSKGAYLPCFIVK
jgi:type IX secretion system PorP/SprF family membrane protein